MKTLYVTDLDGTLLNSKERLSEYTIQTLNELIANGLCFSYATARSLSSASIVTNGLTKNMPVIVYNGTFIVNPNTKEKLFSLHFTDQQKKIVMDFLNNKAVYPLVYGYIHGEEKVSSALWTQTRSSSIIMIWIIFHCKSMAKQIPNGGLHMDNSRERRISWRTERSLRGLAFATRTQDSR